MKYTLLVSGLISGCMSAMDNQIQEKNDIGGQFKDTRIELGNEPIKNKKHFRTKSNIGDIELLNQFDIIESPPQSQSQSQKSLLSQIPFFQGQTEGYIDEHMSLIKKQSPVAYGQIAQMLIDKKNTKRSITVDPSELSTIDQKIQHALLQIALENQKVATQNRTEDLDRINQDRKRSIYTFIISLCVSAAVATPALVLAIINITKAVH